MDRLQKIPTIPEKIHYKLKEEKNNLIRIYGYYDKNPIGTYDYTTLHLTILPLVTFPYSVQQVILNFSEESQMVEQKTDTNIVTMFNINEKVIYDIILYIKPGSGVSTSLKSVILIMKLPG